VSVVGDVRASVDGVPVRLHASGPSAELRVPFSIRALRALVRTKRAVPGRLGDRFGFRFPVTVKLGGLPVAKLRV